MNTTVTLGTIAANMARAINSHTGLSVTVELAPGCVTHDFVIIAHSVADLTAATAMVTTGGKFAVAGVEYDPWKNDADFAGEPAEYWAFVKSVAA